MGVIAVSWMVFIITVFLFPSAPDPNSKTMNYCVVVLGAWLLLSLFMYYCPGIGGVHWFTGPVNTIVQGEVHEEEVEGKDNESDSDIGKEK